MSNVRFVTPGDEIGEASTHMAGIGVYERDGKLFSTLVGDIQIEPPRAPDPRPSLSVSSFKLQDGASPLPAVGRAVTAKIVRVTPRAAHADIMVVDGKPLRETFKGMIRQQDVRQTETDKVDIYKCFAPGDVILAEVVSLGDRHSYFLSTAKNELGVIYARSKAGVPMLPLNWQEMVCPATKGKEFRKVAKP